jgi:hypothetical protein
MKNLSKLFLVFALGIWGLNTAKAQSSLKDDKADKATEVKKLVNNKDYVFEATNAKGAKTMGFVAISKDTLIANLPESKHLLKVSTTNYAYSEWRGKAGYEILIKPKAGVTSDVKEIKMEVTPQGHASVFVKSSHGPLALSGYIKQEDY